MHELFFNLLLVLIPTQLGYHYWPSWATVLGRRVDFLSPTLYLTDILIFLIIIFWRPKKIPHALFIVPVIAFINILFAVNKFVSVYFWLKIVEYILLGLYIVETKPKLSKTIFYLSIGLLYSSAIAIGQFILQRSIGGPLWLLGERTFTSETPGIAQIFIQELRLRAYATFPHPNVLGGYLAVLLPGIIQYSNNPINKLSNKKKYYFITVLFVGIIALVLTFSRSAWVAALLGIILLTRKNSFFIPLLVVSTIIVFLIFKTVGIQDESVVVRQELNSAAVTMFSQSPIFGKGLGNFLIELPKNLVSRQIYFLQPVHNIYLLLLSETGIVGFGLFIWMLWNIFKRKKTIIHYSLFMLLTLGLVDHYPLTLQQGQLLLTILLSGTIIL
jgi:O-antigen ligase